MPQSGTKDNPAVNTPSPSSSPIPNPGDAAVEQAKLNQKEFEKSAADSDDPTARATAQTLANLQATEDAEYVLRDGVGPHYTVAENGERKTLQAGETVKLTAAQVRAFADKFEKK